MPFDVARTFAERSGENFALHERYMNPQLARTLRTLGFDRNYVRGEGCYLYDDAGQRYLDFLSGFGVYALGRSHPAVKAALHQALDLDLPNMIQMDCALLPGLLAEQLVARTHPGISRVFFCNSGAESVEAAIKFARHSTQRSKILYAEHAFHGLTTGALATERRQGIPQGLRPAARRTASRALRRSRGARAAAARRRRGRLHRRAHSGQGRLLRARRVLARPPSSSAASTARSWSPTKCRPGSGAPAGSSATSTGASSPTSSRSPRPCRAASSPRRDADDRESSPASTTPWRTRSSTPRPSAATSSRWWPAWPPSRVRRRGHHRPGRAHGRRPAGQAPRPGGEYELIQDVRGLGLMVGIEFGRAGLQLRRRRFRRWSGCAGAVLPDLVVPLFHRHRIITQVAADNVNIIKLLPPLISGQEEVDYFIQAPRRRDGRRAPGLRSHAGVRPHDGPRRDAAQVRAQHRQFQAGAGPGRGRQQHGRAAHVPARPAVLDGVRDRAPPGHLLPGLCCRAPAAGASAGAPAADGAYLAAPAPIEPGDRVVITGAAGFIGSAVTRAVLAKGARVVAVTEPAGNDANLRGLDVERAQLDIRDAAAVHAAFAGARYVFHLAAITACGPAIRGSSTR